MTSEQINDLASIPALLMAIPWFLFTIIYGVLAPWYKSLLGSVMFTLGLSISLVFGNVLARRWFGEYPGYEWWALGIYTFGFLTGVAFVSIVIYEIYRGGANAVLQILLKRKKK
jgi:hypothetical protein